MKFLRTDIKCLSAVKEDKLWDGGRFTVKITSERRNAILFSSAEFSFDFKKDDKLFLNGYQSWTFSREIPVGYKNKIMKYCPRFLDKKFGFSMYGDGFFYNPPRKRGVNHGYSYAYIRRGEEYILIGSLAENTGFTRIIFNAKENTVALEKDCSGRIFKGEYTVFDVAIIRGSEKEVFDGWFNLLGVKRLTSERKTGYTSWYNYYQNISEEILLNDLSAMRSLSQKPDVFQIDDGFETKVGDWLSVDGKKFPRGLKPIAEEINKEGYTAGLWLAPFVCEKESELFSSHSDWLLKDGRGNPVYTGCNWSGMYALDFYNPEVKEYVKKCIEHYKSMGFKLFKLDFLYAVCVMPRDDKTRAEIMCEAMDFLREVCGDCAILGCGVPLASAFGKVEYCRIGMDMSLEWDDKAYMRIFHAERPSTKRTILNTVYRRQLSSRAFLNDPDVFLLRDYNVSLSDKQKEALAAVNGLFGGVLFASDDFSRYSEKQKALYDVILSLYKAEDISVEEKNGEMHIGYTLSGGRSSIDFKV